MATNLYRQNLWVKTAQGPALAGAQVWVCTQPANVASAPPSPLANCFSDPGGLVPISFPLFTDGFGFTDFYTLPGLYTIVIAYNNVIQEILPDTSLGNVGTGGGGTTITLEVNGASTSNPALLNLVAGPGISLTDEGGGAIQISSSGSGITLKTNGTTNADQALLNLVSGTNVTLSSDAFGDVTINSSGSSTFSGNGAFFYGPGIRNDVQALMQMGSISCTTVNGVNTTNRVVVYLMQLDVPMTVSKCSAGATNNTIGNLASFGIYSYAGALLVSSGTFSTLTTPTIQSNSFTPVTLQPGTYWFAQTSDTGGGSDTFWGNLVGSTNSVQMFTKNTTRCGYGSNVSVLGVLPSTLGTITPFTPSSVDGDGFCLPIWE